VPSSIECWHAHARNPSAAKPSPRSQSIKDRNPFFQRPMHHV